MKNNLAKKLYVPKELKLNNLFCLMKFVFLVFFVCTSHQLHATNTVSERASVQIKKNSLTLQELVSEIEKQSDYLFIFSENDIDMNQQVKVNTQKKTVLDILQSALDNSDIAFNITDNYISLRKKESRNENNHSLVLSTNQSKRISISGKITDALGEPLIGVNVTEKGTINGVSTDSDGTFILQVDAQATLQITYIGFVTKEVTVGTKTTFLIPLIEDTQNLDEIVVIGYGSQKKASLTGSVSAIKMNDELRSLSSSNMSSVLAGTMAGLRINSSTGVPGVASDIQIRNAGSWNSSPPLFVIDGVVREKDDFDRLDVNEVENITILKDAASAAIYGSRSSGGVMLITTKQGSIGKTQIRYTGSFAIEKTGMEMERTSGYETALLTNYIHRNNQGFWYYWDDEELAYMKNLNGGKGYDVLKDAYVDPSSMHHSLTLSGGNDKIKYFVNGSFFEQSGFLNKMDYSRYNLRANLEANVNSNLKVVTQFGSSYGNRNNISFGFGKDMSGLYGHLRVIQPDNKNTTSDGKPIDWGWVGNLKEFSNEKNSGYNKDENQISDILLRMEYKIPYIQGLTAKAQFSYMYRNMYNKTFNRKQDLYMVKKEGSHGHIWTDEIVGVIKSAEPGKEYISQSSNRNKSMQLNFQLSYDRTWDKHAFSALAVYEQSENWVRDFSGTRENFPVLIKDQWFATSDARADSYVKGSDAERGRLSYVGQVNYGYDDKYLLNASLRVDGSMNFPKGKQYGYFPALSGAWLLSEENFFKSDDIQLLKIRGSVGLTGNDNVIGWKWQESYKYGANAHWGTTPSPNPGIQFGGVVNPDITWEKSLSYNIGADMYWKNQWIFAVDAWFKNTYDILGERIVSLPTTFGFSMPPENYGEIDSKGFDIEVSYRNNIKDFNYHAKAVFSYSTNKIIKRDYVSDAPHYDNPIGRPLGFLKGYRDDGIIRTQEQLDGLNANYKKQFGADHEYTVFGNKAELGMLVYKDLGGPNGVPDGKIDTYDQDVISNHTLPPYSAGLTLGVEWKGISVETLLQGDFGYKRGLDTRYRSMFEWNRMPRKWLDHWSLDNPNGKFPDPKGADSFKSYNQTSTFTIHDASFVKMRYLNVGYKLPASILRHLGFVDNCKVFFSATNLLTITNFDYWDPELSSTGSYPNMKTFNFGIDLTF